jgi:hypothetical protein
MVRAVQAWPKREFKRKCDNCSDKSARNLTAHTTTHYLKPEHGMPNCPGDFDQETDEISSEMYGGAH